MSALAIKKPKMQSVLLPAQSSQNDVSDVSASVKRSYLPALDIVSGKMIGIKPTFEEKLAGWQALADEAGGNEC